MHKNPLRFGRSICRNFLAIYEHPTMAKTLTLFENCSHVFDFRLRFILVRICTPFVKLWATHLIAFRTRTPRIPNTNSPGLRPNGVSGSPLDCLAVKTFLLSYCIGTRLVQKLHIDGGLKSLWRPVDTPRLDF